MNATNRGVNRAFIAVVGLVLLALGLGAIAVAATAGIQSSVESALGDTQKTVSGWLADTALSSGDSSWLLIALVVVAVIIIVLLAVFALRQGRGHTSVLVSREDESAGSITIDTKVAAQAIQDALSSRSELVSSHVSTYAVRGTPMLKVSATARRGVSPREVTRIVDEVLLALDAILGVEVPALVHISGGFRARTASATRVG